MEAGSIEERVVGAEQAVAPATAPNRAPGEVTLHDLADRLALIEDLLARREGR